jgi:hypothetical protein
MLIFADMCQSVGQARAANPLQAAARPAQQSGAARSCSVGMVSDRRRRSLLAPLPYLATGEFKLAVDVRAQSPTIPVVSPQRHASTSHLPPLLSHARGSPLVNSATAMAQVISSLSATQNQFGLY